LTPECQEEFFNDHISETLSDGGRRPDDIDILQISSWIRGEHQCKEAKRDIHAFYNLAKAFTGSYSLEEPPFSLSCRNPRSLSRLL